MQTVNTDNMSETAINALRAMYNLALRKGGSQQPDGRTVSALVRRGLADPATKDRPARINNCGVTYLIFKFGEDL